MLCSSFTFGRRQSSYPANSSSAQCVTALHHASESPAASMVPSPLTSEVPFCHMSPVQVSVTVSSPLSTKRSSPPHPAALAPSWPRHDAWLQVVSTQSPISPSKSQHFVCPV